MPITFTDGESGASVRQKLNDTITAVNTLETNNTGTNSGDQDLTPYQLKPSEGAFVDGDKTKLNSISSGAEINTIDSTTVGEPTGTSQILNVVNISQADYDTAVAGSATVPTTLYIIT